MEITENLYVINRDEWRAWLEKNHKSKKEIWLIYYKSTQVNREFLMMMQLKKRSVLVDRQHRKED